MPTSSPSGSSPESLFAAWLDRFVAGEAGDFEDLCRQHAEAAPALRELHGHWVEVEAVVRQFGLGQSLAEKLRARFGGEVDPGVTLEQEGRARTDFTSEVLSRLGGRGPASTRYRIQGEVAHGGMGAVLRVWDLDLRRHLAMKVMLGKGLSGGQGDTPPVAPQLLARFLEEAQVTGQLDHPGIVPVHELGLDAEGRVYFTMKLVKGQTLKEVFEELAAGEGGWTQTRVLGLLLKVCEAMSYAHAKGVIHRDLKPANVMVGKYGEVYVMDWGLAKILGREDEKDLRIQEQPVLTTSAVRSDRRDRQDQPPDSPLVTMDGDVVGTPAYMSPEQAQGRVSEMGPASDVYALGAMLYHLLAGHMPYVPAGARLNNYAVWSHVQSGPPPPLGQEAPQAPAELVAICERAMARDAKGRYADMSALAADLSAYVEGRVVSAYEAGAWAEARKWVRRNKPLAASLAAAVALAIGGLASTTYVQARDREAERIQHERADAEAEAARQNMLLAQRNEAEAKAQQERAEGETAKVLRLADAWWLLQLDQEADRLWPPHPGRIGEMESWLVQARELADRLPGHRETLAQLRARARPWSQEERQRDRARHAKAGELAEKQCEQERLVRQLEQGLQGEARDQVDARLEALDGEVMALTEEVEARRTWTFDSREDQWQHMVLSQLVADLAELEAGLLAQDAIPPDHGWSVPKRLAVARELESGFAPNGDWARTWAEALPAIRAAYPGLDLEPQMGLLPIGPDPQSGRWEFAHLMTGDPAQRGPDGNLVLAGETGLVLVLLPGGTFWMGAQSGDPGGHNYDLQAKANQGPVHEVELHPFFLSKYEMTQGQWLRLVGRNPSEYHQGPLEPLLLDPVETVSWEDCSTWLARAGLALPSEAQWEYGARAGTETPWWTGPERESLRERHAANIADHSAIRLGAEWSDILDWPELDDGYPLHAPAGSFAANAFGLHDVAGNVWEWCRDGFDEGFYARSPRLDPFTAPVEGGNVVARGGACNYRAMFARSAYRMDYLPSFSAWIVGVRPARALAR